MNRLLFTNPFRMYILVYRIVFPVLVIIIDDSDANWWKGSNHRGEGLFPGNLFINPQSIKEKCFCNN